MAFAETVAHLLEGAGLTQTRIEKRPLEPVCAVCVGAEVAWRCRPATMAPIHPPQEGPFSASAFARQCCSIFFSLRARAMRAMNRAIFCFMRIRPDPFRRFREGAGARPLGSDDPIVGWNRCRCARVTVMASPRARS